MNLACERIETPSFILLKNAMSRTGRVTAHPERISENYPVQTSRDISGKLTACAAAMTEPARTSAAAF